MESRIKKLILGYDLCNDYAQISCYNQKTQEMDTICYIGEKMQERIPTVLCRLYGQPAMWVCGYDAWKAVNQHKGILVENFVDALEMGENISVGDEVYTGAELTCIFVRESLNLITKYYPHWEIGMLTIALEKLGKFTVDGMKPLAEEMGFDPNNLKIVNHVSAYEHYALNQKKELWQYDVGLFDYTKRGMMYYHLAISKKRMPATAMATTISLKDIFDGSEIGKLAPPELDRRFLEVVRQVTANKIISTVYLTGEGFEGNWAKVSLKSLCHHRKGFIGSNIFSHGACFFSMRQAGMLPESDFVALNEDVISKSIYIRGSKNREIYNHEMVAAGQVWYEVESEVHLIPDQTDAIYIHLMDFMSQKEKVYPISLAALREDRERPNRTWRLKVKVHFEDFSHCHVCITDEGFGEFYPVSDVKIEETFDIYDENLSDKTIQDFGRLIFTSEEKNMVPYHFGLSGIRIYSLEELCYYIQNHVYAVSLETFGDDLIYWIDKNLNDKILAKRLREGKKNERSLKEFVRTTLLSIDYYGKEEIRDIQKTIEEIELQNPVEAKKVEADNYLRYGKLLEALLTYEKVDLMMEEHEEMVTREFKGNVYHNMGIAYARLANGDSALECFKKAFVLNQSERTRDSWLMLLKILGREEEMIAETDRMLLPPEIVELYYQQLKEAEEMSERRSSFEMLAKIKDIQDDDQWFEMEPEILEWIEKEKTEYRK